ncbi:MAG: hypothetical protein ABSH03_12205 [Candidatus Lustribacter sp.]|jgi:hypothetical protein
MFALALVAVAALVLAAIFIAESARLRKAEKLRAMPRSRARRQPHLEDAIRAAFDGPTSKHGEIFLSYSIWIREQETRLELLAGDPFGRLNEFTRCLIVRHLWRALESLVAGSVVMVDSPPQTWSQSVDATFHDHGIDPWRLPPIVAVAAPQFVND